MLFHAYLGEADLLARRHHAVGLQLEVSRLRGLEADGLRYRVVLYVGELSRSERGHGVAVGVAGADGVAVDESRGLVALHGQVLQRADVGGLAQVYHDGVVGRLVDGEWQRGDVFGGLAPR